MGNREAVVHRGAKAAIGSIYRKNYRMGDSTQRKWGTQLSVDKRANLLTSPRSRGGTQLSVDNCPLYRPICG